jgi:hypothetical protein
VEFEIMKMVYLEALEEDFCAMNKGGSFFHTTLRHENKFDVYARGKKEKTT